MVGTNTSMTDDDSTYLRKVRKPMVEKKRRERMNHSISQLKNLIAKTIKQHIAPMTRVDKADILELTVVHLQQLHQQQQQVTMATEHSGYTTGYKDGSREVMRYFSTSGAKNDQTVGHMNSHLHNIYRMTSQQCRNGNTMAASNTNVTRCEINHISTPIRQRDNVKADFSVINCSPIQYGQQIPLPAKTRLSYRHSRHDLSNHESCMSILSNQESALDVLSNQELSLNVSSNQDSGINVSSYQESVMNVSIKQEVDDSYSFNQDSDFNGSSYGSHYSNVDSSIMGTDNRNKDSVTIKSDNDDKVDRNIFDTPWRPW
ncbi:oxysterol-binding protein hes1 [Mactra antiquata]